MYLHPAMRGMSYCFPKYWKGSNYFDGTMWKQNHCHEIILPIFYLVCEILNMLFELSLLGHVKSEMQMGWVRNETMMSLHSHPNASNTEPTTLSFFFFLLEVLHCLDSQRRNIKRCGFRLGLGSSFSSKFVSCIGCALWLLVVNSCSDPMINFKKNKKKI